MWFSAHSGQEIQCITYLDLQSICRICSNFPSVLESNSVTSQKYIGMFCIFDLRIETLRSNFHALYQKGTWSNCSADVWCEECRSSSTGGQVVDYSIWFWYILHENGKCCHCMNICKKWRAPTEWSSASYYQMEIASLSLSVSHMAYLVLDTDAKVKRDRPWDVKHLATVASEVPIHHVHRATAVSRLASLSWNDTRKRVSLPLSFTFRASRGTNPICPCVRDMHKCL